MQVPRNVLAKAAITLCSICQYGSRSDMHLVQSDNSPADFELVLGRGIHPFYLDMTADRVFEAAVGWKIASVEREDADCIHVQFETREKSIEVCLINTFWLEPGACSHYRVYHIYTEHLQFSDGQRLSGMKIDRVLARFVGENTLEREYYSPESYEEDYYPWNYKGKNKEISLIFNPEDGSSLSIGRMPEFGYGQEGYG